MKEKSEESLTGDSTKKEVSDTDFFAFWKNFSQVVRSSDYSEFKELSLDTITVYINVHGINVTVDKFINFYFQNVFDSSWVNLFFDNKNLIFGENTMEKDYVSGHCPNIFLDKDGNYIIKTVRINKPHYNKNDHEYPFTILEFAKTKTGFKFIGCFRSALTMGPGVR